MRNLERRDEEVLGDPFFSWKRIFNDLEHPEERPDLVAKTESKGLFSILAQSLKALKA